MDVKAVKKCPNCAGGYVPTTLYDALRELCVVKVWCETCEGSGLLPDEKFLPEKDRTQHVRWERE